MDTFYGSVRCNLDNVDKLLISLYPPFMFLLIIRTWRSADRWLRTGLRASGKFREDRPDGVRRNANRCQNGTQSKIYAHHEEL